jgi:hypothetical protein
MFKSPPKHNRTNSNLVSQVFKNTWSFANHQKHIAAHIDSIKFGRDDYGYG